MHKIGIANVTIYITAGAQKTEKHKIENKAYARRNLSGLNFKKDNKSPLEVGFKTKKNSVQMQFYHSDVDLKGMRRDYGPYGSRLDIKFLNIWILIDKLA